MLIHKHTVNSHLVSLVQWLVAHLMSLWLVWQSVVWMMVVLVRQSVVWMMVVLV